MRNPNNGLQNEPHLKANNPPESQSYEQGSFTRKINEWIGMSQIKFKETAPQFNTMEDKELVGVLQLLDKNMLSNDGKKPKKTVTEGEKRLFRHLESLAFRKKLDWRHIIIKDDQDGIEAAITSSTLN